jgi:hypothetical protein
MKEMKKKKIEVCDDGCFSFFWTGVANDRLRNFPSCFCSSRMKKRLVTNVFASFYVLPLISLISPPFLAIGDP